MSSFRYGLPVYLSKTNTRIMMVIRNDVSEQENSIVFADPQKLKPLLDRINAESDPAYVRGKENVTLKHIELIKTNTQEKMLAAKLYHTGPSKPHSLS